MRRSNFLLNASLMPSRDQLRLLAVILASLFLASPQSRGEEIQFTFRDGNVIAVEVQNASFQWRTVSQDGSVREQKIDLDQVQRLALTETPASDQAIQVRKRIADLASEDFRVRQAAERELSDPEFGGPFRDQIVKAVDDPRLEVSYRAKRIVDNLEEADQQIEVKLDRLWLADGTVLDGDAGEFELRGTVGQQEVTIRRADLVSASRPSERTVIAGNPDTQPLQVELFYKPDQFYQDRHRTVDFSTAPDGQAIEQRTPVGGLFVPYGLKLGTEDPNGQIVVSTYPFTPFNTLAKGNSIAVYISGTTLKRFRGNTTIDFCVPGQPMQPAGVKEFGVFIARVDAGRNFILEGYDANHELVLSVDSPSDRCGFMGFRSSRPVCHIRILANPHLFRLSRSRRIDDDYGLDHLCFTTPVPVGLQLSDQTALRTRSGDRLVADSLEVKEGRWSISNSVLGQHEVAVEDVKEIAFRAQPPTTERHWQAVLKDGSRVRVEPGERLVSSLLQQDWAIDEVAGLRCSLVPMRYPINGDLSKTGKVLVFPTCRIVSRTVLFEDEGFRWSDSDEKLLQPVDIESPLGVPGKDPTPTHQFVNYKDAPTADIPTVWLDQPPVVAERSGQVQLRDGQRFVIGDAARFELIGIRNGNVFLNDRLGDVSFEVPLDQVAKIRFPEDAQ